MSPLLRLLAAVFVLVALVTVMSRPQIARITISKREKVIRLVGDDGRLVAEYPIAIGRAAVGAKEVEGDRRTPEGEYFVCVKNPKSRFHLSLGLNYPNAADARRGFAAGQIDAAQLAEIEAAEHERRRPPWDTPLGGEIFIHGRGEGRGGTAGCIAVSDAAIEQIYALVYTGTPVTITP